MAGQGFVHCFHLLVRKVKGDEIWASILFRVGECPGAGPPGWLLLMTLLSRQGCVRILAFHVLYPALGRVPSIALVAPPSLAVDRISSMALGQLTGLVAGSWVEAVWLVHLIC